MSNVEYNAKNILKVSSIAFLFVVILVFGFFASKNLIFGVKIKNLNLNDGQTYTENPVKVAGNAKNAVNLSLNGHEITINKDGDFEETIALLPGYNIVSLRAKDKFGYIDEKNYKLMFNPL